MKVLACVALSTLLCGCESFVIGNAIVINETPASVAQRIVIGQTNKSDVQRLYGAPTSKTYDSMGIEAWFYGSTASGSGGPTSRKTLQVQFGKDGIATYYLLTDADPQQGRQMTTVP